MNDHLFLHNRGIHSVLRHLTCSRLLLMDMVEHGQSKLFNMRKRTNDTRRNRIHCRSGRMRGRRRTHSRGMMEGSRNLHLGMPENIPAKSTKSSLPTSPSGATTGGEDVCTIHHGAH